MRTTWYLPEAIVQFTFNGFCVFLFTVLLSRTASPGDPRAAPPPMDQRNAQRRSAKQAAIATLQNLEIAFGGDDDAARRIRQMIADIEEIDVKPPPPAVGMLVIGDAVVPTATPDDGDSHAPATKRQRVRPQRVQPQAEETLADYPVNRCEVLIPRKKADGDSYTEYTEYCLVVGHRADKGMLLLQVPGEVEPLECGLHSLAGMYKMALRIINPGGDGPSPPQRRDVPGGVGAPAPSPSASAGTAAPSGTDGLQVPEEDARTAAEQFAGTELRLSDGRTRAKLNEGMREDFDAGRAWFGLHALFGQSVVSAKAGKVSHLTFNIERWNDLPRDEATPFVWLLGAPTPGKGNGRLKAANLINPNETPQPAGGVPIFFTGPRNKGGGVCQYAGHFTTTRFVLYAESTVQFKDIQRQARIELSFHHFDTELASAINALPE
jgi:hypothetical protein